MSVLKTLKSIELTGTQITVSVFVISIMIAMLAIGAEKVKQVKNVPIEVVVEVEPIKDMMVPKVLTTVWQEKLCLLIAVYTESRNTPDHDSLLIMQSIVNRAEYGFRKPKTVCATVYQKSQYEGITGKYRDAIKDISWGGSRDFVPSNIKTFDSGDGLAWAELSKMTDMLYDGKFEWLTTATHFVSLQGLTGKVPNFVRDLEPVGVSSVHLLLTNFRFENGKLVHYTKEKPYRPTRTK